MSRHATPTVSIILPTYNRADTLPRAVHSVLSQHFEDWELIVVDDGSTDGSEDLVARLDPRIRLIRQANAGVGAARNTGLAAARGRYLSFLDSDDAWQPHYLALVTAFLRAHPHEHFVTTEFEQDYGDNHRVRHNLDGIEAYAAFARAIGSHGLDLPEGQTDPYLRVYATREPVGEWGREALAQAQQPEAWLYRGNIFRHMRWGYLNWLPITTISRQAYEAVGPFLPQLRSAEDYRFLGSLAKRFNTHMIGVPCAIKYERGQGSARLKQGHLATGSNAYSFELNKMTQFKALYAQEFACDPELGRILRHYELYAGFSALRAGLRSQAMAHLSAAACWQPHLRRAYALLALAHALPHDHTVAVLLRAGLRVGDIVARLSDGQTSVSELLRKASGRMKPHKADVA
jgi:glycosyltransferase involved in cell wall biosynthesis